MTKAKAKATSHKARRDRLLQQLEEERREHLADIGKWAEEHGLDRWEDDELKAAFAELAARKRSARGNGAAAAPKASPGPAPPSPQPTGMEPSPRPCAATQLPAG
jgi:hypothetical protein